MATVAFGAVVLVSACQSPITGAASNRSTVTGEALDVLIAGPGYFRLTGASGGFQYTRQGRFVVNAQGRLATRDSGFLLSPEIGVSPGCTSIQILADGRVTAIPPSWSEPALIGNIFLYRFSDPQWVLWRGSCYVIPFPGLVSPLEGSPGQEGLGALHAGSWETL